MYWVFVALGACWVSRFDIQVIVYAGRIQVFDLLIKHLFGAANVPDTGQQFVKVVHLPGAFQAFVIEGKTFDDVFT
jgi:hypothetical protein